MKVKITVNTPPNQAEKSMETQKNALLGIKTKTKVIEQKATRHNQFYWIMEIGPDEMQGITKKCARGEAIIRKFYKVLFKLIKRANRIAEKSGRAAKWIKRWIVKRIKKISAPGEKQDGLANQIEGMTDDEMASYIKISDKPEMDELLNGELIIVEELK